MATTVQMLEDWFDRGVSQGATHMIVVCDTFDWSDYPVYVSDGEDARTVAQRYGNESMQRVMEVYDLRKPRDKQMKPGARVFNY